MKNSIALSLCLIIFAGYSQNIYPTSQTEFIFSSAKMNSTAISSSPVVRFSGFLNHESQLHVNFNKKIGFYTGIGIKNIGMINRFDSSNIHFKQRAYALSVPLALKLGKVNKQAFIAIGAEANILFNYKEKFLYGNTKTNKSEWFSNKVNTFNTAVFFQIKFLKSQIITFKYFLNDFLRYQPGGLKLPDGTVVSNYGKSSKLFYVSWGSSLEFKDPKVKIQERKATIRSAKLID
jgi:hypothetical protein